jgi:hypothetical protein
MAMAGGANLLKSQSSSAGRKVKGCLPESYRQRDEKKVLILLKLNEQGMLLPRSRTARNECASAGVT